MLVFIALDKHCKRIPSTFNECTLGFEGETVGLEPVECWRCGSIEMLDVRGVDEFIIRMHECAECGVCNSCRHYDGYRCPDWPGCHYEI